MIASPVICHALVRYPQEDELVDQFHLSKRQLTRILRALVDDGMIHDEDIAEQARTRRMREEEAEELALARGADDVVVREQRSGKTSSNGDDSADEEDDAGSGYQRESTIRTRCYYINPRWFVDMVSYRVFLMRVRLTAPCTLFSDPSVDKPQGNMYVRM